MSRDMIASIQATLTQKYRNHELSAEQYAALMEDTRLIGRTAR